MTIIRKLNETDQRAILHKPGFHQMEELQAKHFFTEHPHLAIKRGGANKDNPIQLHKHNFYEMVYIHKGSGIHKINDQVYTMLAGDFYMMSPADGHEFSSDNRIELTNILFKKEFFVEKEWEDLLNLPGLHFIENDQKGPHKIALSVQHNELIENHLKNISTELTNQESGWQLAAKSALISCLVIINRAFSAYGKQVKDLDLKNQPIRDTLQFILQNYKQPLNAAMLAKRVHISTAYFGELFKKETGLSLNHYLNKIRIDKARVLIESNTLNISEIAQAVGIDDNNYFSRIFKKHCGISPTEFKNICR